MKKRWIIIALIGAAALAVGVVILTGRNKTKAKIPEKITQTIQVQKSDPLSFNGISKSKKTQSITLNQALGENLYLEKQDGESVMQGELIATYYSFKDYNTLLDKQSRVRQKKAEIDNLKKDVQSNSAKITALTNEVNQLNKEITKMRDAAPNKVYAQFDGVLTMSTSSSDGMKPLAEISSNEASVAISVSEYDLSHLSQDQEVKLAPVDSGTKIKGTITSIATRPENTTSKISTYTAQIKPSEELKNGSHVQVTVSLKEIKVPNSAVKEEDKKFYVYKANGSKYTKKEIQGAKQDSYFVVTGGLKNNESIVKNYKDAD
ncbi:efflux RND transporter periplasmic adaptor subunit [Xylocopilactobacillus apis]|uniref:Efflux RND transporter periplasmic adaptor subunit n=1 Tax=Xylocopilactobacillus apis TaxID=2932183 RepID=A0AAU9CW40_9LACO|nr:HlyD family efflux transporter periplasmic adaptor subunit [Xylocopilactobacillus apis]BDR55554.1 hypothetical protein KIMC2_01160 [Xylocopilactobacillus apis]